MTKNIRLTNDNDIPNIEKLLDETFGPGRFARTAYRYREKRKLLPQYSYVYQACNDLLASISFCEIVINNKYVGLLLGPLAVKSGHVGKGYGFSLVETSIELIKKNGGYCFIVLVGDIDYYKRFDFKKILRPIDLIGPVNPDRLLILNLDKKLVIDELKVVKIT